MNRLLRSQLRKHFGGGPFDATRVRTFLDAVGAAYDDADEHSRRFVHSVETMSSELLARNAELALRHERLERLSSLVLELARGVAGGSANPTQHFAQITETCVQAVGVTFASVWRNDGATLRCLDRFDQTTQTHTAGAEIHRETFPVYFASICSRRTIAAHDALHDLRTRDLEAYLVPLGVSSMLDAAASVGSEVLAVLCLEHVGPPRHWTNEEIAFAGSVADLIALVFETQRRRDAERALDREQAFLRQVLDLLPSPVYAKDAAGCIVLANDAHAAFCDTTVADLLGRVEPDPLDARVLATLSEHMLDATPALDARGAQRWLQTVKRPIIDAEGRATGVLTVATELTAQRLAELERARLETNLRQAQRLESLGLLAGGIAHDLNNLLTPILLTTSMVREDLDALSPLREDMDIVLSAAGSARDLIGQLLAFGRKQHLSLVTIDLHETIQLTLKLITRLLGAGTRVELALGAKHAFLRADASQLQQVVVNLVMNARDAMPRGGVIRLTTSHATLNGKAMLALHVSDTGIGMTEAVVAQIFDPFFTTKELGRGTGLGLASVHGIVTQHGGAIEVRSVPNEGTTFSVLLPRHLTTGTAPYGMPVVAPAALPTVLLVEDESPIRNLARRVLVGAGYEVLSAEHAEAAIAIAQRHEGTIDLLLTDVVLPGISGPSLFDQLYTRPVPRVLFMSGYARDSFAALARANHAFLRKPFTALDLTAMVKLVLAGTSA